MKSITIHDIQIPLSQCLKTEAVRNGMSLNKTIKRILSEYFGLSAGEKVDHKKDFEGFLGVWSKEDQNEFKKKTEEFEKISPEDWS